MPKRIVIHIGPHKTGSTALQYCFKSSAERLLTTDIHYLELNNSHKFSQALDRGDSGAAEIELQIIKDAIAKVEQNTVLISSEDYSGDLPGRNGQAEVYPSLARNIEALTTALDPHNVEYIFVIRDMEDWLESVYAQNLRWRSTLTDKGEFFDSLKIIGDWDEVLQESLIKDGANIHLLPYSPDASLVARHFEVILGLPKDFLGNVSYLNVRSPESSLREFERINKTSEFRELTTVYKEREVEAVKNGFLLTHGESSQWPRRRGSRLPKIGLSGLDKRINSRQGKTSAANLMPDPDVDLDMLAYDFLPAEMDKPAVSRAQMENQVQLLRYFLRGKSQLCYLNALAISYLRRDTDHTAHARDLFLRLWREQGLRLSYELSTRWLISTMQTFSDHGATAVQRQIGAAGFIYGNMVKIYEGERLLEGLQPCAATKHVEPKVQSRFKGLDRYSIGGTDLLLNTNAYLLELAEMDPVAGLPLAEFLLRTKSSCTVFSRNDKTRSDYNINIANFTDTWTFFDEPEGGKSS